MLIKVHDGFFLEESRKFAIRLKDLRNGTTISIISGRSDNHYIIAFDIEYANYKLAIAALIRIRLDTHLGVLVFINH
jgi:hypothetical protein